MKTTIQKIPFFVALLIGFIGNAQDVYPLWEGETKPYYKENDLKEYEKEAYGTQCVFDITEPTLTVYPAKGENTGKSVVIIPGGGYPFGKKTRLRRSVPLHEDHLPPGG